MNAFCLFTILLRYLGATFLIILTPIFVRELFTIYNQLRYIAEMPINIIAGNALL
mgnify:CR=1 FL=1|jgi:hypothetical protein